MTQGIRHGDILFSFVFLFQIVHNAKNISLCCPTGSIHPVVFTQRAAQENKEAGFPGGAVEGLWPQKQEDLVFTQIWVLEVWSDPWVDHEILLRHNYKNMVLAQKWVWKDKSMMGFLGGGREMLRFVKL